MRNKKIRSIATVILSLIFISVIACTKGDNNPTYFPPADHTVSIGGHMHKSGLDQPLANCSAVACHGADLKGATAPSCYTCHNKKW